MLMSDPFLYVVIVITITRLVFQWNEQPITRKESILKTGIELIALLPLLYLTANSWQIFLFLLVFNLVSFLSERNKSDVSLIRFLVYIMALAILWIFEGKGLIIQGFNHETSSLLQYLGGSHSIGTNYASNAIRLLAGVLLLINEMNHLIRFFLKRLKVKPYAKENSEPDPIEITRGRAIGALERITIFILAITGPLSAIGFILAAKGLARFKELEEREYAEYIIIGTLMSALTALMVGLIFKTLVFGMEVIKTPG